MQAVSEERLPIAAVVCLIGDTTKVKFVRKLLSESKKMMLKKSIILMDRELGNVVRIRFLDRHGEKFLMAVSRTPGIKKAVLEFCSGKRKAISKYEMISNNGTTFRFWLVIKKRLKEKKGKRRWEYLTYATNVKHRYIKRIMKDVPE